MVVKYEAFFQIWWIWCNISCDFRHFRKTHVPLGVKKKELSWCWRLTRLTSLPGTGVVARIALTSRPVGISTQEILDGTCYTWKTMGFFGILKLDHGQRHITNAPSDRPEGRGGFQWDESRSIVSTVPSIVFWGNRCSLRPMNGKIPNWTMFLHGVAETTRFLR
jgi:hypothetical protein